MSNLKMPAPLFGDDENDLVIVTDADREVTPEERFAVAMVPASDMYSWGELIDEAHRLGNMLAADFLYDCRM